MSRGWEEKYSLCITQLEACINKVAENQRVLGDIKKNNGSLKDLVIELLPVKWTVKNLKL